MTRRADSEHEADHVVGAGPVGLTTALGLSFYGLPFQLFEEDDSALAATPRPAPC